MSEIKKFQVEGLEDLRKSLSNLSDRDWKAVMFAGVRAGQNVLRPAIKAAAPVRTGELKHSIKPARIRHSGRWITGGTKVLFTGRLRETGHKTRNGKKMVRARPWIAPAVDSVGDAPQLKVIEKISTEIDKRWGAK